jgi:hypothetical protein
VIAFLRGGSSTSQASRQGNVVFDFLARNRLAEVKRFMQSHMNRHYLRQVRAGERRAARGAFCEVVWMIECPATGSPAFEDAIPLLTRDVSADGLALLHREPIEDHARLLIGLHNGDDPTFLRCRVEHVTALGYGHYQVGLRPEQVVEFEPHELRPFRRRVESVRREQGPGLPRKKGEG